jgi:peptidoglycan/LPS O-acetylase OafA/YrhL
MLTYAYMNLQRSDLKRFYWRRFVSVGIPYLCWTLIYFFWGFRDTVYTSAGPALAHLADLLWHGYYQLYFLLVIMQFYLVFPLLIAFLRWTRRHHGLVLAAAVLAQLAITSLTQLQWLPSLMQRYSQPDGLSYPLYLIGGCIVALHFEQVDAWVRSHARLIFSLTVAAALVAEGFYFLGRYGVTSAFGPYYQALTGGDSPFLPTVIPFNIAVIASAYLAGVALTRPNRSRAAKAVVRTGVDDAYGVYLAHLLVLNALMWLGWESLLSVIPWPVLILLTVAIVFAFCVPLTELLARTPLAMPLTGRRQVPWHKPGGRRPDQLGSRTAKHRRALAVAHGGTAGA